MPSGGKPRQVTEEQATKISRLADLEAIRLRATELRDELAVELLREGVTYQRIGFELGVSHTRIGQRYGTRMRAPARSSATEALGPVDRRRLPLLRRVQ